MELRKQINQDLNSAIKAKDEMTSLELRMLLAAIFNKEKEKRYRAGKENPGLTQGELTEKSILSDEEVIDVVFSEVKKRRESAAEYQKAKRNDLADKENKEIDILKKYLPQQLSEEEIKKIVQEAIEQTGAQEQKDMGKVMNIIMPQLRGKADGNIVSKIVKELLIS